MIPKATIDEIFQTARVEEVIGEFLQLKKSGANYKAKSPFVDERTPSFMVSPAKNIWKCFASGKGGNVVSFLMEHEHFSYVEALRWLANKYNIAIPEERARTPEEIEQASARENLSIINEFARDYFSSNLHTNEQGKAIGLSYFVERGFREETIKKFQLGYCLDESDAFTKAAIAKKYKLEYLEQTGLTKVKEDRSFDFFRGRVMFPIHSVAGKVLGFGGRTLKTDKKVAKYFNSPESELYNKSKILYGLYFAKNTIIKNDRCYLVEGYTDVISLHQSGIENVVASSGTALTYDQIKLIKRYSDNITILYDGDAAGIRASFRGIDMILEQGMNVKVVLFPDGEDPDSFAKKSTTSDLEEYIEENSKDFIVFKSDVLLEGAGNDPIKKAELINEIVGSVAVIEDAIKRQIYCRECASIFDIDEQTIVQAVNKVRQKTTTNKFKSSSDNQKISDGINKGNEMPMEYDIPIEAMIPPEYADQVTKTVQKEDKIYPQEYDLVRILLNYGLLNVHTQHITETEDGKEKIEDVEVSVTELIIHEMEKDDIVFKNEIFQLIYDEVKTGMENNVLYEESHFVQHENLDISRIATDITISKYELSPNWYSDKHKTKILVRKEVDKLDRAVMEAIYSYKNTKVQDDINTIQNKINDLDMIKDIDEIMILLAEQKKLEGVRKIFSEKLGRIVF